MSQSPGDRELSARAAAVAWEATPYGRDWGYRLEDIRTEVHRWHGELHVNVPAEWRGTRPVPSPAARPTSFPSTTTCPWALGQFEEVLATLVA